MCKPGDPDKPSVPLPDEVTKALAGETGHAPPAGEAAPGAAGDTTQAAIQS